MPWAKLHTDILGDPKLMRAARNGMKGLEYLPWIIAFAKESDDDGRLSVGGLPAEPEDFVSLIPNSRAKIVAISLQNLEQIGVLSRDSDDFLRFSAWEQRSGAKSSDSPEAVRVRVARHRAKKKEAQTLATQPDSAVAQPITETGGNGNGVTLGIATEKRREEKEVEGEENSALPPALPRANGKHRTAPPDWAGRIADRWISRVGAVTPVRVQRALSSSVATHGEEAILAAIDAYSESRLRAGKDRKLEWFAEDIGQWVKRAGDADVPIVEDGWFSPAGDKATRP
ncbi:MAG: hypothetical protein JWL61_5301 [Gemmatimonadetes bacterium]|nr:hypothetical protein [Gemmatimonadota bacterium]